MKEADQWLPDFDDPEDLTPEERLTRIVRILALGAIRLAEEENARPVKSQKGIPNKVLKLSIDSPKRNNYASTQ